MSIPATNQPDVFVPTVPIYTNGVMAEVWRIFFQTLLSRTGGNVNQTITVNDLITQDSGSGDNNQIVAELLRRLTLVEANDAFNVAMEALETVRGGSGITAGQAMAYGTLGIR